MKFKLLVLLALLPGIALWGQKFREHEEEADPRNKGKGILLHLSFAGHLPAANLSDRFGLSGAYGGGLDFITANNYFIGFEGHGIFGQEVKDDPLAILRTPEGDVIGNNRAISVFFYRQRGMYLGGMLGKLFTIKNERKGIRVSLGAGWLQHRIKIQDDENSLTQVTGEYRKGYDRLTGGLALNQFVGWQILGKMNRTNFMLGLEMNQGFTHTLRDWDFTERRKLDGKRVDLRFGIKMAWTLPFYMGRSEEIFY